jgi:hypothetical protein
MIGDNGPSIHLTIQLFPGILPPGYRDGEYLQIQAEKVQFCKHTQSYSEQRIFFFLANMVFLLVSVQNLKPGSGVFPIKATLVAINTNEKNAVAVINLKGNKTTPKTAV